MIQENLDFDSQEARLRGQWHANAEREAKNWTDEALCIMWACGMDDRDWWNGLKSYERRTWLHRYLVERHEADAWREGKMRSANHVLASEKEAFERDRKHAESWAADIRKAFLERKPCPIIPAPGFEWMLAWAFRIAQVPKECMIDSPSPN